MSTLSWMFVTFWGLMFVEPTAMIFHKGIVVLYCVLQAIYFVLYFLVADRWLNDDSTVSWTFSGVNDWSKAKLVLTLIVLVLWLYLVLTIFVFDKHTYERHYGPLIAHLPLTEQQLQSPPTGYAVLNSTPKGTMSIELSTPTNLNGPLIPLQSRVGDSIDALPSVEFSDDWVDTNR